MISIGVTGGIGSGKSAVCKVFERQGAAYLNADDLAKELMVDDPGLKQELKKEFGDQTYHDDGSLNRKYLAEQAFKKGKVERLNNLVHPRVREASLQKLAEAEKKGKPAFVYEAALLLDKGRPSYLDYVVLVTAEKQKRLKWVTKRDKAHPADVEARIKKQLSAEELEPMADFVIENNGTIADLRQKANVVYHKMINADTS